MPHWLVAWSGAGTTSVLEVTASGAAAAAVERAVPVLAGLGLAGGISRGDDSLWGAQARGEAAARLGWVELPETSRGLVDEIAELREDLRAEGVDRVVLAGMGGSSLAARVIARTAGVSLTLLDTTDPDQVRAVLGERMARTVVVVASKSGATVETDGHRRAAEAAFAAAGVDPRRRIIVVTDPGSPLEALAVAAGYRAVFRADPRVGGRFSALTAVGLVPSGLAGADVEQLLDDASAVADLLADDGDGNPALVLGAALAATEPLRDKILLIDSGSGLSGFTDWAEQLLAESTGKDGTGLLPVVVDGPASPEALRDADDVLVVRLLPDLPEAGTDPGTWTDTGPWTDTGTDPDISTDISAGTGAGALTVVRDVTPHEVTVTGPLGAQLLLWQYATAVAGRLLGINPFDQPDVGSTEQAARDLLTTGPQPTAPDLVDGPVEVRATPGLLRGTPTLGAALDALLAGIGDRGYLALMAYLNREREADLLGLRARLADRTGRPVTLGWGPALLHSAGQYHKGGPLVGAYLQVSAAPDADLEIPGRPYTFGRLIAAQAAADAGVLAARGLPVLRLHLTDRTAGLARLRAVVEEVCP